MNANFPSTQPLQAPPLRLALSIEEAAEAMGIGRTLCFRLIKDGELAVTRIHGRSVVQISEIQAFLARRSE